MDIIISNAKELVDNGSQPSIEAAIQYVLNEGIFGIEGTQGGSTLNIASFEKLITLSNIPETIVSGEGTCCPDCNIYYLGNILRFLQYAETYTGGPLNCCLNTFIGVESRIVLQESIGALPQTCCNNFNSCINEILSLHKNDCYDCEDNFLNELDIILGAASNIQSGIVEYGTINGRSLLCDLITALKTNGLIEAGGDNCSTLSLLRSTLAIGIFVWCEKTCNLATEDNEPILTENSENIQPEVCPEETITTTTTTTIFPPPGGQSVQVLIGYQTTSPVEDIVLSNTLEDFCIFINNVANDNINGGLVFDYTTYYYVSSNNTLYNLVTNSIAEDGYYFIAPYGVLKVINGLVQVIQDQAEVFEICNITTTTTTTTI
jgi:hypothetical protein